MNRNANPYSDFGNQNLVNEQDQDQAMLATIDNIKKAHEKRVAENKRRAGLDRLADRLIREVILEQDIEDHEQWLRDVAGRRVFTDPHMIPAPGVPLSVRYPVTKSVGSPWFES